LILRSCAYPDALGKFESGSKNINVGLGPGSGFKMRPVYNSVSKAIFLDESEIKWDKKIRLEFLLCMSPGEV